MKKDFQTWHKEKSEIDCGNKRTFFHEREVWWCSIGMNIGFEQDGKGSRFSRPVLILKGFSKEVFLAIPLTTKMKTGKYYHPINLNDDTNRNVILSQIRLLDAKRLQEKLATIDNKQFSEIKKAVIRIMG